MKHFLFTCIALFSCSTGTKSTQDWIMESAIKLPTVNPLDLSTTDLQHIGQAIGSSRVVLLGEAEHGDGSTFLLKSRIVKYLHKELGFKVIAFEASFYGLETSWEQYMKKQTTFDQVKGNLYTMWRDSRQCEELFKYIEAQSESGNELILTGIDSRQVGEMKVEIRLDSVLRVHNLVRNKDDHVFFRQTLKDLLSMEYRHKIPITSQNRFLSILQKYEQELSKSDVSNFWIQEIKNTRGYALHSWRSAIDETKDLYNGSFRDKQMADNLIWLANEKYNGEKIIVWAANAHVVKNFSQIDSLYYGQDEIQIRGAEHSLGEYLADSGLDIYSIITVNYSGKGADFNFQEFEYENAKAGSIEEIFHRAGFKFAFLDVKNVAGDFIGDQTIRSGLPGYVNVDLKAMCDGIFYVDEMCPITKAKTTFDNIRK